MLHQVCLKSMRATNSDWKREKNVLFFSTYCVDSQRLKHRSFNSNLRLLVKFISQNAFYPTVKQSINKNIQLNVEIWTEIWSYIEHCPYWIGTRYCLEIWLSGEGMISFTLPESTCFKNQFRHLPQKSRGYRVST